ncbi:alpha/beta hydrolase [Alkalimonas sp. MEB108]|uniref:Alpha/beta hydrolase n=1 Tax=Alkalimonas cellulosilytica TaxID=3058395 RepID=A0ABU7J905_9GAMM|nr:alpha/beta hydrolase [Alkalimonas sp. MEB108]MEE2002952.1 alpha/beta hydrolase [Alkalimonas sp. MEB108]
MTAASFPVERRYLALRAPKDLGLSLPAGAQLHLRSAGDPERPLLLLLHQAPSHSAMFEPLMQLLASHYCCVAPDLPGCGQSDALISSEQHTASISALAACLTCSLASLQLDASPVAAIVGHHTGAAVAAEMAAFWLPGLQAAVLSGPPLLDETLRQRLQNMPYPLPSSDDGSHLLPLWQYLRAKDPALPLAITERELCSALQLGKGYQQLYQAVAAHDFAGCLRQIACPTLLMAGQQDALYAAMPASLKLLKQGQLQDLGMAGTYVFERQPELLANVITDFLTSRGV